MSIKPALSVQFFRTSKDNEPVREWLKQMKKSECKIIGEDIKLVQFRWPLGMPLVRKMDSDLWEVRSKLPDGKIARIFFTIKSTQMIVLHGFIKKSQKTPLKEIELANSRKKQWFSEV